MYKKLMQKKSYQFLMKIPDDWIPHIQTPQFEKVFPHITQCLREEKHSEHTYYPNDAHIFQALISTQFANVKVVILGQDPYHSPGQAHGLSFSVPQTIRIPPSLRNIFLECEQDLHIPMPHSGDLTFWAKQGVLLLNTILTVRHEQPLSHQNFGWEQITDEIIMAIIKKQTPVVFLLWGKKASDTCIRCGLQNHPHHLALKAPHPSPFSAHKGFFGCRHFSKTNAFLSSTGQRPIDWANRTFFQE